MANRCVSSIWTFSTERPVSPSSASRRDMNGSSDTTFCTISAELLCTPQSTEMCTVVGPVSLRTNCTSSGFTKWGKTSTMAALCTSSMEATVWATGNPPGNPSMSNFTFSAVTRGGGGKLLLYDRGGGGLPASEDPRLNNTDSQTSAAKDNKRPTMENTPNADEYHALGCFLDLELSAAAALMRDGVH